MRVEEKAIATMSNKTLVKICGLTDVAAIDAALEAGADMLGFVFFAKSPRNLSLEQAKDLVHHARASQQRADIVTLFVDPSDKALDDVVTALRPDFIQLHGGESPARVEGVQNAFNVRVIKAVGVATSEDVHYAQAYDGVASRILFDAKPPPDGVLPGGNGLTFDWTILDGVRPGLGYMLSGGLTPDNVAEAIALTGAEAVDVSSGVEAAPGVKDPELIRHFIAAAKAATKAA